VLCERVRLPDGFDLRQPKTRGIRRCRPGDVRGRQSFKSGHPGTCPCSSCSSPSSSHPLSWSLSVSSRSRLSHDHQSLINHSISMQFTVLATALLALIPFVAAKPTPTASNPTLTTRALAARYSQCVGSTKKIALTFDDGVRFNHRFLLPNASSRTLSSLISLRPRLI